MTEIAEDIAAEVDRTDQVVRRAPAPLDLVQALVNTLNRIGGYDLLADPTTARWWFTRTAPDLDAEHLGSDDLTELVRLREALRGLLRHATSGEPLDPDTRAALDDAGRRHPVTVSVDPTGKPHVTPAAAGDRGPANTLATRVLAALPAAAGAGTLDRLKACANPGCEWAFYDTSRSRSGSWCVMNVCGARHKMARYRERQRSTKE